MRGAAPSQEEEPAGRCQARGLPCMDGLGAATVPPYPQLREEEIGSLLFFLAAASAVEVGRLGEEVEGG